MVPHTSQRSRTHGLIPAVLLSLSVGAVVALFSPLDALVLQPLPFRRPQELVRISRVRIFDAADGAIAHRPALNGVFRGVAAYWGATASWLGSGAEVRSVVVTREFFPTLGIRLRRGRGFTTVAGGLPQAVISYPLWRSRQRASATGVVQVDGRDYRVAGVAPKEFAFPGGTGIWELGARDQAVPDEFAGNWVVFGRLRAGKSLAAAGARLRTLTRGFRDALPAGQGAATLEPLYGFLRGDRRDLLWSAWA
ncbi:MAG: ABC transporter permease, partial [Terriglobales bacterium]